MPARIRPPFAGRPLAALASSLTLVLGLITGPAPAQVPQRDFGVELALPGQPQAQRLYAQSHALVIGASAYTGGWSSLPGVRGDVVAVRQLLEGQGFQVRTVLDPTYAQLDAALRNFIVERGDRPENRLLVYFAGHGHTLTTGAGNRLGYIVPVDAPPPTERSFRARAYSMESVEALSRQIESRHVLFLFDSCFSGTIFRTRSGVPDSISAKTAQPVRQFITAGDENQPVPDESIFRRQLEAGLGGGDADLNRDGYITGSELGMFLEDTVTNYSRKSQTPRHGKIRDPNLDKGDFVFRSPFAPVTPANRDRVEDAAWALCQNGATRVPCDDYLGGWPQGRYAALARTRIRDLAAAGLQAGQVLKDCADCPEMVVVGAGSFNMGSPAGEAGRDDDEGPQRPVGIGRAFAMGRTEVTVGQWRRFVQATNYVTEAERNVRKPGCKTWEDSDGQWDWRAGRSWRSLGFEQSESHPVVCVSHNDALAYVQWLSRSTGQTYRLPSEAEWEYAARAGTTTSRPWGDDANQACRWANGTDQSRSPGGRTWEKNHECNDGYWFTAPVRSYGPNAFGLNDMLGNAWEWMQDCQGPYRAAPGDGSPKEEANCDRRVLRGGGWAQTPQRLRSAYRDWDSPDGRDDYTGFRLARTVF